jgi:hypothetical protein
VIITEELKNGNSKLSSATDSLKILVAESFEYSEFPW